MIAPVVTSQVCEGGGDSRVTLCDDVWHWHANRAVEIGLFISLIGRDWFDPRL